MLSHSIRSCCRLASASGASSRGARAVRFRASSSSSLRSVSISGFGSCPGACRSLSTTPSPSPSPSGNASSQSQSQPSQTPLPFTAGLGSARTRPQSIPIPFQTTPKTEAVTSTTATATNPNSTQASQANTPTNTNSKAGSGSGSGSSSSSSSSSSSAGPTSVYDYVMSNRSTILVTLAVVSTIGYAIRMNQVDQAAKEHIKVREYVIDDLQQALARAEQNQRVTLQLIEQHGGKPVTKPQAQAQSQAQSQSQSQQAQQTRSFNTSKSNTSWWSWWPASFSSSSSSTPSASTSFRSNKDSSSASLYDAVLSLYLANPLLAAPNTQDSADVAHHLQQSLTIQPTPQPNTAIATSSGTSNPVVSQSQSAPIKPSGGRPLM